MTSKDLKILADTLLELKQRWPEGLSYADKSNVISFLNSRLKQQQVSDFSRKGIINYLQAELRILCE